MRLRRRTEMEPADASTVTAYFADMVFAELRQLSESHYQQVLQGLRVTSEDLPERGPEDSLVDDLALAARRFAANYWLRNERP